MSPKSVSLVSGEPPSTLPRFVTSNTQTSARPMPSVVKSASGTPLFCPRCAVVMKARLPPGPANTMSRGSSPTRSVRTTRGGLELTSTMLTLSERWLTTQTCTPSPWAAAAIGSRPTGTEPECVRFPCASVSKISSRSSGVFTA